MVISIYRFYWMLLLLVVTFPLHSAHYYFITEGSWDCYKEAYAHMRELFKATPHTLTIANWVEVKRKQGFIKRLSAKETERVLFYTHNPFVDPLFLSKTLPEKRAVVLYEGPVVAPRLYTKALFNKFHRVVTFSDDLVNGEKFKKYRYCPLQPMIKEVVPFHERKLACMMNRYAKRINPLDLTREREKIVQFYRKKKGDFFDLYGRGWKLRYKNYKNRVEDKISAIKHYKFYYCLENTKGVPGYITEKIFDCFQAGVVPIYYGAPNIADEIPANCFIDYRDFSSLEELHRFIVQMDEATFNAYMENIRLYLDSDSAKLYSQKAFAESFVDALLH